MCLVIVQCAFAFSISQLICGDMCQSRYDSYIVTDFWGIDGDDNDGT